MTDEQVAPTLGDELAWLDRNSTRSREESDYDRGWRHASHLAHARLRNSLYGISQPCETCGGRGKLPTAATGDPTFQTACSDCNGQGYRCTGGLVERILERLRTEQTFGLLDALSAEIGPNPEGGET